jgi:3-phosphoshikimate 1-carboxyvinyltransferase
MFGIEIESCTPGFRIRGGQRYVSPGEAVAEGDWSNAAFFLCMGALGGRVSVSGLSPDSIQGDKALVDILRRFGAEVGACPGATGVFSGRRMGGLKGIDIDASQIPDLVPALSVVAAVSEGETRIYGAGRLRFKESDRIESVVGMLSALGADVCTTEDGMIIRGRERLSGGEVCGAGDHRIVMAATAAACVCEGPVVISGAEAINKSYPAFFEDFKSIGGVACVV